MKSKPRKYLRRVVIVSTLLLGALLVIYRDWTLYVLHLAKHQYTVIANKQSIQYLLSNPTLTKEMQDKLRKVVRIREFAREIYNLKSSETYSEFTDLKRPVLGYNLTIAPEFSLEPVEFSFPLVGKFSYLGFFDEDMLSKWEKSFIDKHHDIHRSEIGAYSTLGWFRDPLLSTYLNLPEIALARLILHEISHEKIYFHDDSTFSESVSSFVERKAAALYVTQVMRQKLPYRQKKVLEEYQRFWQIIDSYRQRLRHLYASAKTTEEKRREKRTIIIQLANSMKALSSTFKFIRSPHEFTRASQINNAMLLQVRRYSVVSNSFESWYNHAGQKPALFLELLEQMKNCPKATRAKFLESVVEWNTAINLCQTGR